MKTRESTLALICILTIPAAGVWAPQAASKAPAASTASTHVNAVIDAGKTFAPFSVNIYQFTVK